MMVTSEEHTHMDTSIWSFSLVAGVIAIDMKESIISSVSCDVCMCAYVCMCMCACICVHVYMCACVCACVYVYVCMCMCACVCVHVYNVYVWTFMVAFYIYPSFKNLSQLHTSIPSPHLHHHLTSKPSSSPPHHHLTSKPSSSFAPS